MASEIRIRAARPGDPFYERCGFRMVGTVMTALEPAVELRKDLARRER